MITREMTLMLVFSEIMAFMWQYYVTKDTKLLRQWKHSFKLMDYVVPVELFKSINQSYLYLERNNW